MLQAYDIDRVVTPNGVREAVRPDEFGGWYKREDLSKIGFSFDEQQLLRDLGKAHNAFCGLPVQHPSDIDEWVAALHDLQKLVMVRVARRMHPDLLTNHE